MVLLTDDSALFDGEDQRLYDILCLSMKENKGGHEEDMAPLWQFHVPSDRGDRGESDDRGI